MRIVHCDILNIFTLPGVLDQPLAAFAYELGS
jgi:hypothetical protein